MRSGNKSKRCCYGNESNFDNGVIDPEICAQAFPDLAGITELEMRALFDQLLFLRKLDLSLQVPLPPLCTPHLEGAVAALQDDDPETFDDELMDASVSAIDHPDRRRALADAVIALRDRGCIDKRLAAMAIFELDREELDLLLHLLGWRNPSPSWPENRPHPPDRWSWPTEAWACPDRALRGRLLACAR